jgi:hypothetical protein
MSKDFDLLSDYYVYNQVMEGGSDFDEPFPAQHKQDKKPSNQDNILTIISGVIVLIIALILWW